MEFKCLQLVLRVSTMNRASWELADLANLSAAHCAMGEAEQGTALHPCLVLDRIL